MMIQMLDPARNNEIEWEGTEEALLSANEHDEEVADCLNFLRDQPVDEMVTCGLYFLKKVDNNS